MREILFKAKRIDNGEWVEGFYCKRKHYCFDKRTDDLKTVIITEFSSGGFVCYEVNPNTICQYTGHEDDNGKKIFENDLIECKEFSHGQLIKHFLSQVEWDDSGTGFTFKDSNYSWAFMDSLTVYECEVVGNIFDHPEQERENEYE